MVRPVGGSRPPASTDMRDPSAGFQNRLEPQSLQNPRSAWSEAAYHCKASSPEISLKLSGATAVAATAYPVHCAHWRQWHTMTSRIGGDNSKRMAPHRQRPFNEFSGMAFDPWCERGLLVFEHIACEHPGILRRSLWECDVLTCCERRSDHSVLFPCAEPWFQPQRLNRGSEWRAPRQDAVCCKCACFLG